MTEDEIMIRAREAAIAVLDVEPYIHTLYRHGEFDGRIGVAAAEQALRDLSKPLSEIQPVDPDLVEAREIAGANGCLWGGKDADVILAAIKRGRELERGIGKPPVPLAPQVLPMQDWRNLRLEGLDLSARLMNCAKIANVQTLGEAVEYNLDLHPYPQSSWLRIPHFGRKSLNELRAVIQHFAGSETPEGWRR